MKIDFSEIKDWQEFEDLVADYFREIKSSNNNLIDVRVEPSGSGPDGGIDILLTFDVDDSIISFKRIWVVQCKFYERNLLKNHLSDVNIANLLLEYNADGYLLICKNNFHSGVTNMFENLRNQASNNKNFEIWNGNHFRHKLGLMGMLHKSYFPKYYQYNKEQEVRINKLEKRI